MSNERFFDTIADEYRRSADENQTIYDSIEPHLSSLVAGKEVLEVGNGGRFSYETSIPERLIAMDIAPKMLESITDSNIVKVVGDARSMSAIADASVDVIIFQLVLHHITGTSVSTTVEALRHVLKTARLKLRPNGRLVIAETILSPPLYAIESLLFSVTQWFLGRRGVSMIFFFSWKTLRSSIAREFGISEERVKRIPLDLKGWIDPLAGSFPGVVKIPARMHPAKFTLIIAPHDA